MSQDESKDVGNVTFRFFIGENTSVCERIAQARYDFLVVLEVHSVILFRSYQV